MPKEYSTWVSELEGTIEDASTIYNKNNTNSELDIFSQQQKINIIKHYKKDIYNTVCILWAKLYSHDPISKEEADIFIKMYLVTLLNMWDGTEFDKFGDIKIYNKLKELFDPDEYYF